MGFEDIARKNPDHQEMKLHDYHMIVRDKNLSAQFVFEEDKKRVMDDDTREQLRALGYIGD